MQRGQEEQRLGQRKLLDLARNQELEGKMGWGYGKKWGRGVDLGGLGEV